MQTHRVLEDLGADGRSRVLATLAKHFGDLDFAEEMLQEALVQALRIWPERGMPRVPEAWLTTAAKRKGVDAIRRDQAMVRALPRLQAAAERGPVPETLADPGEYLESNQENQIPDERLGLFFACAHPVLKPQDQVALTLRFLGGLSTAEVAHALLVPVATMQQRILRAKKRIRTMGIPFEVPNRELMHQRLAEVQRVIYLLYTEGFARSAGDVHIRHNLTEEAIRLARILHSLIPGSAEVTGLLGLLLLTEARGPARTDENGSPVPLAEQNRKLWNRQLIREGVTLTEQAAAAPGAGAYATQAAIAALHAEAESFAETDWAQIAVLYSMLESYEPTPVVKLGRAVALGRAQGLRKGLTYLESLAGDPQLDQYRPFHIARAVTLEDLGDYQAAATAYRRALELEGNEVETRYLNAALVQLDPQP